MPARLDPTPYLTVPTRSAAATLGLAQALLSVAPSRPSASQALHLARLRERAERLQQSWVDVGRHVVARELRKLDRALDQRWSALRGRLHACVLLGDDELAPRAKPLLGAIFPTGLDFLKLPYIEEWAQSERRLAMIAAEGLEGELGVLCGEPYLARLRGAHEAYGEALGIGGIGGSKDAPAEAARVLGPLEELKDAIVGYACGVIGGVSEEDPEGVTLVERVLEPIVRARRAVAPGEDVGEEAELEKPERETLPEFSFSIAAAEAIASAMP